MRRHASYQRCFGLLGCAVLVFQATLLLSAERQFRTWTSADGKYKTEARLIELRGNTAVLEKSGGGRISVPLNRLSAADQQYARKQAAAPAPSATPTAPATPAPSTPAVKPPSGGAATAAPSSGTRVPAATVPASPARPAKPQRKYASVEEEIAARLAASTTKYRRALLIDAHLGRVSRIAFSADGRRLITCGDENDSYAAVWDAETGRQVSRFEQQLPGRYLRGAISSDGKLGAVGGEFKKVHIFDADTGKLLRSHDVEDTVSNMSFSDDGKWIIAADSAANVLRLPVVGDGATVKKVAGEHSKGPFRFFAASPDAESVVVGDTAEPTRLVMFSPTPGEANEVELKVGPEIFSAAASERWFLMGDIMGEFLLRPGYEFQEAPARNTFSSFSAKVDSHLRSAEKVALSRDNQWLGMFKLKEPKSAVFADTEFPQIPCRTAISLPVGDGVSTWEVGPDLLTIAVGKTDGAVEFWKLPEVPRSGELRFSQAAHEWLVDREYDKLDALFRWVGAHPDVIPYASGSVQQGLLVEYLARPRLKSEVGHLKNLKDWFTARPDSGFARLCLAHHYMQIAYAARGTGFSNTVSANGLKLFHEYIQRTLDTLEPMMQNGKAPPCAYETWFRVATAQGWKQEKVEPYVEQLLKVDPAYYPAHNQMALKLLPRWGGRRGDTVAYARRVSDKIGGPDGDALYARVAAFVRLFFGADVFLDQTGFDYDRIMRGLAQHEKKSPGNQWALNESLVYAMLEKDETLGRQIYDKLMKADKREPIWTLDGGITWPLYVDAQRWAWLKFEFKGGPTGPPPRVVLVPNATLGPYRVAKPAAAPRATTSWKAPAAPLFLKFRSMLGEDPVHFKALAFSPSAGRLAALDDANVIHVLNPASGEQTAELKPSAPANAVAWSPDGSRLAVADDIDIHFWAEDGSREFGASMPKVSELAFSPDGKYLVASGPGRYVRIWQYPEMVTLPGFRKAGATSLAFSPDGETLLLPYQNNPWNVLCRNGRPLALASLTDKGQGKIAVWSGDGRLVAFAGNSDGVRIFDAAAGKLLQQIKTRVNAGFGFLSDGRSLVTGDDSQLKVWDAPTAALLETHNVGIGIKRLSVSPDGKALAVVFRDRLTLWQTTSQRPNEASAAPPELAALGAPATAVSPAPRTASPARPADVRPKAPAPRNSQNPDIAVTPLDSLEPPIKLVPLPADTVDATKSKAVWECYLTIPFTKSFSMDTSPQGTLAWSRDKQVFVFGLASGDVLLGFNLDRGAVNRVAFVEHGENLAILTNRTLATVNAKTGKRLKEWQLDRSYGRRDFSAEGNVALLSDQSSSNVITMSDMKARQLDLGEAAVVLGQALSPNGRLAAVKVKDASGTYIVKVFDSISGELLTSQASRAVYGFASDDRILLSQKNGKLGIFDVRTSKISPPASSRISTPRAWADPNGTLLFTTSYGKLHAWNLKTGTKVSELQSGEGVVYTMNFFPEHKGFVTHKEDIELKFWAAKPTAGN